MGRPRGTQPPQRSLVPSASAEHVQASLPQDTSERPGPPELTFPLLVLPRGNTLADPFCRDRGPFQKVTSFPLISTFSSLLCLG